MVALVAFDESGAIGLNGGLPWSKIKEDFKWFKEFTMGKTLIMGRKTYDSLPLKKLPGRYLEVLSRNWEVEGCLVAVDEDDYRAIGYPMTGIGGLNENGIVCGGAEIYKQLVPKCDEIYITHVAGMHPADTYFPYSMDWIKENFKYQYFITSFGPHKVIKYSKNESRH